MAFIFLILVLFVVVGPLASIAALNTLFNTNIDMNFWTWLSMAWVHMVIASRASND